MDTASSVDGTASPAGRGSHRVLAAVLAVSGACRPGVLAGVLGSVTAPVTGWTTTLTALAALPLLLVALPAALTATRGRWGGGTALTAGVAAGVAATGVALGHRVALLLTGAPAAGAVPVEIVGDVLGGLVLLVPLAFGVLAAARLSQLTGTARRAVRRGRVALVLWTVLTVVAGTALSSTAVAAADPADPRAACLSGASTYVKRFDLTALDVDIPINRFGQHDPKGRMYAPNAMISAIRAEEKSRAVSIGLRDDPVQSLVIRANEGDCVEIRYTNNATGGDYGVHIDGLEFAVSSSGDSVGDNPSSSVRTGGSATYRFAVPVDPRMEGAHYLHPGPGYRAAVDHGLFGTLVIEPPGSTYWNSSTANVPLTSGWEAVIVPSGKAAFRENVLAHHEIGNDNERIKDRNNQDLPQVDDTTGSYRPGAFALNYRSEPFRNRLLDFPAEKSHSYSSYTFGDPATPMMRGYLADPTKIRLLHAGGEKFHIYHLHGGGDRWRYNPVADTTYDYADTGLLKDPPTTLSPSQRLDSQSIGPGESYNLEIEGGAGGVQQAAGDFLFHCHIAKHYVSGMWSFWRVYDTRQPDLVQLPDRVSPPAPVDSTGLIGRTFDGVRITAANLDSWIRPQLPPSGVPHNGQDPTVWNWKVAGTAAAPLYLGAPNDPTSYTDSAKVIAGQPNLLEVDRAFRSATSTAENRPAILFDPTNGRPAYPLFRTHIGQRPPFTPQGHSGAPWLGENAAQAPANPLDPWGNRPDGLCPQTTGDFDANNPRLDGTGTTGGVADRVTRHFNVVAIAKPIQRTPTFTDREGKIFVLAKDKAREKAAPTNQPLAIRANQGDCIGVTLTSEIPDADAFDKVSKTTMHIHHVQFDPQGSDGVSAGFAFEHSVRPYTAYDPKLAAAARAGDTTITLTDVGKYVGKDANGKDAQPFLAVSEGTEGIETVQVRSVDAATRTIRLVSPLTKAHAAGDFAGDEFIQYRWYPDIQLDNIFWHDHVDGIHGWGHGLVGQLIIEPKGSTYHDPATGATVDSGTLVDIRSPGKSTAAVGDPDVQRDPPLAPELVNGSFRELALWTIDDNDKDAYSTLNLQAEPLGSDSGAPARADPAHRFSSYTYGDPRTPLPRLYPDDPLVVRTINVSPTIDTLHFQGARTLLEPRYTDDVTGKPSGTIIDTVHYGVSEKFTLILNGDEDEMRMAPGDYLYVNGVARRTRQGAWGIVRVLPGAVPDLQPLPGVAAPASAFTLPVRTGGPPPAADTTASPCATGANPRAFDVTAADARGDFEGGRTAFIPTSQVDSVKRRLTRAEPLVMHVAAGDCVTVTVRNARSVPVSFAAGKLDRTAASGGVDVGFAPEQNVAPGGVRVYTFAVPGDRLGTAAIADLAGSGELTSGLYGAVVVAPEGATFADPKQILFPRTTGSQLLVHVPNPPAGTPADYRDVTVVLADDDARMGQDFMPYPTDAEPGESLINYQEAPPGDGPAAFRDPGPVPVLTSYAGDPMVVHVLEAPGGENAHVFGLGGLRWPQDVRVHNANLVSAQGIGPWESFDAWIDGGAGGTAEVTGDFFYGDQRRPFTQQGMWGLQRVLPLPATGAACPMLRVTGTC